MSVLISHVEHDEAFDRRRERMAQLVAELRERTALVARGGGDGAVERHRARGKLTARERVERLVDPGSAFLELNALAAWELYDDCAERWGVFPHDLEHAHALRGAGRCLLALDRPIEAAARLQEARESFAALKAVPLVAETDDLLARATAKSS